MSCYNLQTFSFSSFLIAFVTLATNRVGALSYLCKKIWIMKQLHAHEVLHMMEGNTYTEASLREAVINKFGKEQHFYTCSAEDMDVDTLIEFLKRKGKFMPIDDRFTVDVTKVCSH